MTRAGSRGEAVTKAHGGAPQPAFYGRWIVIAGASLNIVVSGSIFYGLGAFFAPIQSQFDWSYATVSWAFSAQAFVMGATFLSTGWLVDRLDPRSVAAVGTLLAGISFVLLGQIQSTTGFYFAFALMGLGAALTYVLLNVLVAIWFDRWLGLALAMLQTGSGIGALTAPMFVWLIEWVGWRPASLVIGLGIVGLGFPLALLLRGAPQATHRQGHIALVTSDHEPTKLLQPAHASTITMDSFGLGNVLRSSTFWTLLIVLSLSAIVTEVIFAHQIRALMSFGVAANIAGLAVGVLGPVGLFGRYGFGWLAESIDSRYMFSLALAMQGAGVVVLSQLHSSAIVGVSAFVLFFGIGQAGLFLLSPLLQRNYFGVRDFGTVQGFVLGVGMLVGAVGPIVVGALVDLYGSYRPAFLASGCLVMVLALLVLLIPRDPRAARLRS